MIKDTQYRTHLMYSVLMHMVILTVLIISFEFSGKMPVLENSNKNTEIINAVVITDSKIEMPKPSFLPPPKNEKAPKKMLPQLEKATPIKPQPEVKKQPDPIPEKKTIAILDPRKKLFQQQLIEKQMLADLQKQTEKQKHVKQKALEAAFEKEIKATAAKSLEQQLLKETKNLSSARAKNMQGVVDKYKALILQAISQNWLVPYNANKNLKTELMIRVAPDGSVLAVQIVSGSGDSALDRSAMTAVYKASPLPVPANSEEFELFRQFTLKLKPENIAAIS